MQSEGGYHGLCQNLDQQGVRAAEWPSWENVPFGHVTENMSPQEQLVKLISSSI